LATLPPRDIPAEKETKSMNHDFFVPMIFIDFYTNNLYTKFNRTPSIKNVIQADIIRYIKKAFS